jgi:hypothetical protein
MSEHEWNPAVPEHLRSGEDCMKAELSLVPCKGQRGMSVKVRYYIGDGSKGRWFITMGHPGFNSPANNAQGYASKAKAEAALRRYSGPRVRTGYGWGK